MGLTTHISGTVCCW